MTFTASFMSLESVPSEWLNGDVIVIKSTNMTEIKWKKRDFMEIQVFEKKKHCWTILNIKKNYRIQPSRDCERFNELLWVDWLFIKFSGSICCLWSFPDLMLFIKFSGPICCFWTLLETVEDLMHFFESIGCLWTLLDWLTVVQLFWID